MQSLVFELYGSKYTFDYQRTIHIEREGLKIGRGGEPRLHTTLLLHKTDHK